MTLTLAVPLIAISPWLVPLLYGSAFEGAVLPLVILVVGTIGFAVMIVLNNFILGQLERPGLLSIVSWLELALSVPTYIIFINWQGIVGAAMASTITYLFAMSCTLYIFLRHSELSLKEAMLPRVQDFRDYAQVVKRGIGRLHGNNGL